MNKMLVCDFDGTIETSSKFITKLNFSAIKKFREHGNKLVIASGRHFKSLKKKLDYYECQYDALICNGGCVGININNTPIFEFGFKDQEISQIEYCFYGIDKNIKYNIHFYNYNGATTRDNNPIEIVFRIQSPANYNLVYNTLRFNLFNYDYRIHNNCIYVRKNLSKSDGIYEINKLFEINDNNIYTIGNGKGDFEMIRDYNGYNVLFSHQSLNSVSKGTVLNVAKLVKKIETK